MRALPVAAVVLVALATSVPTAAQSPSGSPAPATAWAEVAAPVVAELDALEKVVSTDPGIVAIGSRCEAEGDCERIVLATTDGMTWTERGRLPDDVDLVADLVADGGALYLVGDRPVSRASVWRSTDGGGTWALVDPDAFPGSDGRPRRDRPDGIDDTSVRGLARGPAGLVATAR
jgi:photosystem II stability/assembly factor-like uncharacterized protein